MGNAGVLTRCVGGASVAVFKSGLLLLEDVAGVEGALRDQRLGLLPTRAPPLAKRHRSATTLTRRRGLALTLAPCADVACLIPADGVSFSCRFWNAKYNFKCCFKSRVHTQTRTDCTLAVTFCLVLAKRKNELTKLSSMLR